jgi:hypothetical protein
MNEDLIRQIRRLKLINTVSLALLVLLVGGWVVLLRGSGGIPPWGMVESLDVMRINVLNEDGHPALVIAGQGKLPGPTFEGKEYPQELSGGRTNASGMIFFNERGDEVGGLTFAGDLTEEGYAASGHFSFDQFRQDQVVAIQYGDDGSSRRSGINVWDRSTEISIAELLELVNARLKATGSARDSLDAVLQSLVAGGLGAHRVFLGSQDRTAMLRLQDTEGRTRIRLSVDSLDEARLELLDAAGDVVWAIPR